MNIEELILLFSYPFVQKALIVGILISICAAILGVILVLKRYSLIGHGLGDVSFASISLALALGLNPLYVSMIIVIIASFIIMMISQKKGVSGDVTIGVVATFSLSLGVIITALAQGFNTDVYNYMFGSILAMENSDIIYSACLAAIVIIVFILSYNRLFSITYDENYAKACGINVTFYQFLISFLTALTVVFGMKMMGTLLVSSLIIFPAISARSLVKSFKGMVILSAIISALAFLIGIVVSFIFSLPTGASIVIVNVVIMIIASIVKMIRK